MTGKASGWIVTWIEVLAIWLTVRLNNALIARFEGLLSCGYIFTGLQNCSSPSPGAPAASPGMRACRRSNPSAGHLFEKRLPILLFLSQPAAYADDLPAEILDFHVSRL